MRFGSFNIQKAWRSTSYVSYFPLESRGLATTQHSPYLSLCRFAFTPSFSDTFNFNARGLQTCPWSEGMAQVFSRNDLPESREVQRCQCFHCSRSLAFKSIINKRHRTSLLPSGSQPIALVFFSYLAIGVVDIVKEGLRFQGHSFLDGSHFITILLTLHMVAAGYPWTPMLILLLSIAQ